MKSCCWEGQGLAKDLMWKRIRFHEVESDLLSLYFSWSSSLSYVTSQFGASLPTGFWERSGFLKILLISGLIAEYLYPMSMDDKVSWQITGVWGGGGRWWPGMGVWYPMDTDQSEQTSWLVAGTSLNTPAVTGQRLSHRSCSLNRGRNCSVMWKGSSGMQGWVGKETGSLSGKSFTSGFKSPEAAPVAGSQFSLHILLRYSGAGWLQ